MTIDIMIGGAQKSGTTSVRRHLSSHPGVSAQLVDELGGLTEPDAALGEEHFERQWFEPGPGVRVGKLAGFMYQPDVVRRFHLAYPQALHVLVLRDPVERAYSAFWHMRRSGLEPADSMHEAVLSGPERFASDDRRRLLCDYVGLSRYDVWVEQMLAVVRRDQLVVFEFERVRGSASELNKLLCRVDLDPSALDVRLLPANTASQPRSRVVARLVGGVGLVRQSAGKALPRTIRRNIARRLRQLNQRTMDVPPMPAELRHHLVSLLETTGSQLSDILGIEVGGSWASTT